jgi:sn-glycerol 3-phosphate transport system substrate-binding protein
MTGANNDVVNKLAEDFNASQKDYKVVAELQGPSYADTMNAGIAAFRAGNAPHILQVFEVGTATMMAPKARSSRCRDDEGSRREVRSEGLSAGDHRLLLDAKGEMLSFPFNSSSMVMWYNKDAFKKAGLDPNAPPKTWPEVFDAAKKLKAAGHADLRLLQCLGDLAQHRAVLGLAQHVRSAPRATASTASTPC